LPTFACVPPGATALGPLEFDDDEAHDRAIIRREGEPDRPLVGRAEFHDPERFDVLVERVESPGSRTPRETGWLPSTKTARQGWGRPREPEARERT
jgi:hypothetical protein